MKEDVDERRATEQGLADGILIGKTLNSFASSII